MFGRTEMSGDVSGERLDPITVEVVGNALVTIADEARAALIRSAYSANVKERQDCACLLLDGDGRIVSIGNESHPVAIGFFMFAGVNIFQRFPKESIRDGDIFILNDPYTGGPTHLADVTLIAPVFHQGELIGFVGSMGHWPDVGGKSPGQCALGDATEIYQEGLRIPPMRLYRAGELQGEVQELVLLNVRDPIDREGDIRAQLGSVKFGMRRMQELAARYGAPLLRQVMREHLRVSEVKVRHGILQLKEGIYEAIDYIDDDMDSDRPVPLKVKVTVAHRPEPTITVDFSGTAPPMRWGLNCTYAATASGVYWPLRSILDPTVLANDGFWRPIKLIIPERSLLGARPPSPVGARYEVICQLPDLLFNALAPAVPGNIEAGGHGVHAMSFSRQHSAVGSRSKLPPASFYYETIAGGGGARPVKDGIDGVHTNPNLPVEAMEVEFSLMAECVEYITDSGGAGRFRGGLGVRKEWRILEPTYVGTHSNRHRIPGPGLMAGSDGTVTRIILNPDSQEPQLLPRQGSHIPLNTYDVVRALPGGGGGYGDPMERDPQLVLQDVINEKVSVKGAQREYGVVVNGATREVDLEATAHLRERLRKARQSSGQKPLTAG